MIGTKNAVTNIFRIQAYDSTMYGYLALDLPTLCSKAKT